MSLDLQYDVVPWKPDTQKGVYYLFVAAVKLSVTKHYKTAMNLGCIKLTQCI